MKDEVQVQEEEKVPFTEEEAARFKDGKDEPDDSIKQIGSVNPIEDFKKMINDRKIDRVQDALRQMQSIIERYVRCSLNGDLYEKAFDCLKSMRQACISEDEAPIFNKFMDKVKDLFSIGPHQDFFGMMVRSKFSLITNVDSEISSAVTEEEAREFLKVNTDKPKAVKQKKVVEEDLDLIE